MTFWTALSAIFFALLLIFELFRYFWPGWKAKRQERRELMREVGEAVTVTIDELKEYDTTPIERLPDPPSPGWLRERVNNLKNDLREYEAFRNESFEVICEALRADYKEVRLMDQKWSEAGAGSLADCVLSCLSEPFWEAQIDPGFLRNALMERYGKNRPHVGAFVNSSDLYDLVQLLNKICERKTITHVGELRASCLKQAQELEARIASLKLSKEA